MIVAITKLRKLPKTCKECRLSNHEFGGDRFCTIAKKECPVDLYSGRWVYGKPGWCPLAEIDPACLHDINANRKKGATCELL